MRRLTAKNGLGVALIVVLTLGLLAGPVAAHGPEGKGSSGHYIVQFQRGVEPGPTAASIAREHGLALGHVYKHALSGCSCFVPSGRLKALQDDPRVKLVEPDIQVHTAQQTLPTGVDRINADENDGADIDGSDDIRVDVDIAILDTGIDKDHPDLNVADGTRFYTKTGGPPWERGSAQDDEYDDDNGHGSHVAGIAAAIDNDIGVVGVAPGARLWAVKVLDKDGSGYLSDVIAGVDWVTQNAGEIEVANMSLGATGVSDSFHTAIQNSVSAGVVYVVAAGNDSKDIYGDDGTFGTDDDAIPAAYPEVATISAMADSDGQAGGSGSDTSYGSDDSFASFSNFSKSVIEDNPVNSTGAAIDLLLPGVDIYSTYKDGGYATMSGTSMSSPHGAGLAALYIAENARASNATEVYGIRQALLDGGVAQNSADGLATLNDPDGNREIIGWASGAVGESPTVAWVNPKDDNIVSGNVTIQIDASDTEDDTGTLAVEWRVDDGSWQAATYNSDTGYYEDTWDTTGVNDGDHLDARATDNDGNTASAGITVTTENVGDPPTVSWVNPKDGDTVSGNVTIQIDASDDRDDPGTLDVDYAVDGGTWRDTNYNPDTGYYEDTWDTTLIDDGDYTLDARATDSAGNKGEAAQITVNVTNEAGGMYVWDISWRETGPHLKVTVTILADSDADGVAESSDDPVSDATVDFTLTNRDTGESQSYTGTTDSKGQVEFQWKFAPSGNYKGEVTEVTHS